DMLSVLLMTLEDLETRFQEALKLRIDCGGYEDGVKRAIHLLVISDLVRDVGLVELFSLELHQFRSLLSSLLRERAAGFVILGRDTEFFDQVECLLVHCSMVAKHVFGEPTNNLVLRF